MGSDKAMIEVGGIRLVDRVATAVAEAAGNVTIVGAPERYGGLGYPVVADLRPGCGPLGGIETALDRTTADWNLIVACDMPGVSAEFLRRLIAESVRENPDCLLPRTARGPEPLCAVYHRRCLEGVSLSLERGIRKVTDGLAGLRVRWMEVGDLRNVENINNSGDLARFFGPHDR
jgi:molybdopterin-guanine dinucleotide biosynthesis protein A